MKMRFIYFIIILGWSFGVKAQKQSDSILVKQHLLHITEEIGVRNHLNLEALNATADYIMEDFIKYADSVSVQKFYVNGKEYKNIIASFGIQHSERIIVGAHYDVCNEQKGADDNASGVVGLMEIARLLSHENLNYRIDLVAFTLEEPPYFRTNNMGSYVHSQYLKTNAIPVYGMISLEMIGYFNDEKHTQDYPIGLLSLFYGKKGNYITLVNQLHKGKFARKFKKSFKKNCVVRTKAFGAPKNLTGIDWSDHLNYWNAGYSALMITDTSFYRNKNYHESTDTIATLNITKMTEVITSIYYALIQL